MRWWWVVITRSPGLVIAQPCDSHLLSLIFLSSHSTWHWANARWSINIEKTFTFHRFTTFIIIILCRWWNLPKRQRTFPIPGLNAIMCPLSGGKNSYALHSAQVGPVNIKHKCAAMCCIVLIQIVAHCNPKHCIHCNSPNYIYSAMCLFSGQTINCQRHEKH